MKEGKLLLGEVRGAVEFSKCNKCLLNPYSSSRDQNRRRTCPRHGGNPEEVLPRPGEPRRLPGGSSNPSEA